MTAIAPEQAAPANSTPDIYQALALVMRDTLPVGKDQVNQHQRYNFRGIDDLMSAVAGPMRTHGVFIIPSVADLRSERRGEKMTAVFLTMSYRIYGPSGDFIEASVPGEASDTADKATNKAMSAALKYLLLQVLMIPIDARSIDDGDRHHPENPSAADEGRVQRSRYADAGQWETSRPAVPQQPTPQRRPVQQDSPEDRAAALTAMQDLAKKINFTDSLPAQFIQSFGHPIDQGTAAEFKQAYDLMAGSAAA
jgi:hypothetical protein